MTLLGRAITEKMRPAIPQTELHKKSRPNFRKKMRPAPLTMGVETTVDMEMVWARTAKPVWRHNISLLLFCFHTSWNYYYIIIIIVIIIIIIIAEGEKIKKRQFNHELTFNGLICKGIGLSQCSL